MPCSGPVTARQRLVRLAVLLSWMVLLTVWSDQQALPLDQPQIRLALFNMQPRLAHLFAYGALGIMATWAFEGWRRPALMAIILASIFGATDEWQQSLV